MAVSVIIPTLNEEGLIRGTIERLRRQKPHEIIVVDGGSTDKTVEQARGADRVFNGPRGRAAQMNFGAAGATGDAMLFLHADCRLEKGCMEAISRCLRRRDVAAGCFRMTVDAHGFAFRMIDAAATARVRLTGFIYGDQGLFLTRNRFNEVGGFPDIPFMEDVFASQLLRRKGRIAVLRQRIFVSPRRWQRQGILRQTLLNWKLTALAALGTHPDRFAASYPVVR
ncbi:MAG: TIGR04283 family arsenosugar biosynthesis glycosyltransferase [Candidatus Acidiferrum sp.]